MLAFQLPKFLPSFLDDAGRLCFVARGLCRESQSFGPVGELVVGRPSLARFLALPALGPSAELRVFPDGQRLCLGRGLTSEATECDSSGVFHAGTCSSGVQVSSTGCTSRGV